MKEIIMLILGSLITAVAVEESKLHERIALKILLLLGTELKWLLLGVMLSTMFLSMWIINTAATAIMIPIVEALLQKISASTNRNEEQGKAAPISEISVTESKNIEDPEDDRISRDEFSSQSKSQIRTAFFLSICYSANIGGTGTLTGTGANFLLKGLMEEYFPGSNDINFASWMMYNVPGMLVCIFIAWIFLWRLYIRSSKQAASLKEDLLEILSKRYKEQGSLSYSQIQVLVLFIILLLLWLTQDPKIMNGWVTLIGFKKKIGAVVPAIAISFLLFLLPSDIRNFKSGPILKWKKVQRNIQWEILLIIGGGFALADAAQKSGLSTVVQNHMTSLRVLPSGLIVLIVCLITTTMTEFLTNITTNIILFPIISLMASAMRMNPLYVLLPLTVTSSFAFMLPVGTPPNAIVFASSNMKIMDMVKPGIWMNIVCLAVQMLMINSLGAVIFDVHNFPSWANNTVLPVTIMSSNETLLNSTAKF
nr:solute carrier family 13 member 5-like [Parasteatoda tepidariorum]